MTSQVQDAYAAGFFDGEGCVIVSVSRGKGQVWTGLVISIHQLSIEPLEWLHSNYGGNLGSGKTQSDGRRRVTTMGRWSVNNRDALEFMKKIRPYTILKSEEIDAALEWPHGGDVPWRGAWNPMPQWAKEKRFGIRNKLKHIREQRRVAADIKLIQFDDKGRAVT